jgi:hypothetical protein
MAAKDLQKKRLDAAFLLVARGGDHLIQRIAPVGERFGGKLHLLRNKDRRLGNCTPSVFFRQAGESEAVEQNPGNGGREFLERAEVIFAQADQYFYLRRFLREREPAAMVGGAFFRFLSGHTLPQMLGHPGSGQLSQFGSKCTAEFFTLKGEDLLKLVEEEDWGLDPIVPPEDRRFEKFPQAAIAPGRVIDLFALAGLGDGSLYDLQRRPGLVEADQYRQKVAFAKQGKSAALSRDVFPTPDRPKKTSRSTLRS